MPEALASTWIGTEMTVLFEAAKALGFVLIVRFRGVQCSPATEM